MCQFLSAICVVYSFELHPVSITRRFQYMPFPVSSYPPFPLLATTVSMCYTPFPLPAHGAFSVPIRCCGLFLAFTIFVLHVNALVLLSFFLCAFVRNLIFVQQFEYFLRFYNSSSQLLFAPWA